MAPQSPGRVGYLLKRYPRYSETFIVTEIRAHLEAGLETEIFALLSPQETHFQDVISHVRAPVTYLNADGVAIRDFWAEHERTSRLFPEASVHLAAAHGAGAREVYQAMQLAQQIHVREIEHLHAHFANEATTVARLAARLAGVPYTFTLHAKDIFHADVRPEQLRCQLNGAAAAVTVSDYNLRYLRETYGPAAVRVQRIYNGVRLDEFPYSAPLDRTRLVVGVGRLVEKKGFTDLIDACSILAERGVPFRLEIAGAGELESSLGAQIDRLGLGRRAHLAGPLPQRQVSALLRSASVLVVPSVVGADGNRDGLPTVLLEAMALGTPTVATDVTGIPEVVRHEETGLLMVQGDPASLAEAIQRMLDRPDERVRLARNARRLIEAEFDSHRNAAELRELFASASSRRDAA